MEAGEVRTELAQMHTSAFGWAMVCCGRDRDLGAEVLQQAYCRILSGDALFKGKSEFSTWVFGVIRLVALEEFRNQKRRQFARQDDEIADRASSIDNSDRVAIEQRELAAQLETAMATLSDRQREVLHLTFYENMTIEQAANILEISVGSARQHYQRGKASLRRILATSRELEL